MNTEERLAISRPAVIDVQRALASNISRATSAIELVLRLPSQDLNLRDLSRFLVLVDRAYGRVLCGDLRKYAWNDVCQLRVSRIRAGSWEVVLTQVLDLIPNPTPILVLYVVLRLLPKAFKETAGGVLKLSTAYNNYEQARLARANRKALRSRWQKTMSFTVSRRRADSSLPK